MMKQTYLQMFVMLSILKGTFAQRSKPDCGAIPVVEHSTYVVLDNPNASPTLEGRAILYKCNKDYMIVGNERITCSRKVGWQAAPECVLPVLGYGCNYRFDDACTAPDFMFGGGVPHSHCQVYKAEDGTVIDANCKCDDGYIEINPVLCQVAPSNNEMYVCPKGWVNFDESCYLFNDKLNKTWTEATGYCASLNSNLVTIESKDEDMFLQGYSNKLFKPQNRASNSFWAGATDAVTEGSWRWYNRPLDSHLSYSNWAFGQPDVSKPNVINEDCLCLFGYANFQWHDCHCGSKDHFICEFKLPRQCSDGWVYFKGSCYLFNDVLKKGWTEAKNHCASLRANLVTIESKDEDVFLQDYSNKLFKPPNHAAAAFWAGATDTATEGIWRWFTTGSRLSYTNWPPRQPDTRVGNIEDCLCLYGRTNFQWHGCHCNRKSSFICEMRLAEKKIVGF